MKRKGRKGSKEQGDITFQKAAPPLQDIEEESFDDESQPRSKRRGRPNINSEPMPEETNENPQDNDDEIEIVSPPKEADPNTQAEPDVSKPADSQPPKLNGPFRENRLGAGIARKRGNEDQAMEKRMKRVSEDVQLIFPYECKAMLRNSKQQAFNLVIKMNSEIERQSSALSAPLDDIEREKVKKAFRRVKYFVKEVFAKMEEITFFEKLYAIRQEVKVNEINESLHNEHGRLTQILTDLIERMTERQINIEQVFCREIELYLETAFPPDDVEETENNPKIKFKGNAISFDMFLEKFFQTQKEYFIGVQICGKMLDENFDLLKIELIKKFRLVTNLHSAIERVFKLGLDQQSFAEQILFENWY